MRIILAIFIVLAENLVNAENSNHRPPGRPKTANPATERLPVVRITPDKLATYRKLAGDMGVSVSEWIRVNLDASIEDEREEFMRKRRESRINDIEIGRYYLFKIPGNYKTLGYVIDTEGNYVEFRPYKKGLGEEESTPNRAIRNQRVNKDQIIDVVPASRQMLLAADEPRLY